MIFLIEYDRSAGIVRSMQSFGEDDRRLAEDARLRLELKSNQQSLNAEIVLLEAPDESALRLTHRRYFEDLLQLARSSATTAAS